MSRKNRILSTVPSSVAVNSSLARLMVSVPWPAARRFFTQSTSPNGPMSHHRPAISATATGVDRGRPVLRPRTVSNTSGPIGTPAARSSLAIGLNRWTQRGT